MRLIKICACISLACMLLCIPALLAGEYQGAARFTPSDLVFSKTAGFDVARMAGADFLAIPGSPFLPYVRINVALPDGAAVTDARVLEADFTEIEGTYDIMPATRARRISNPAAGNPFVKDPSVYGKDALFPGYRLKKESEWDLAGQQFVTLDLFPVQYNPATGRIYLAENVSYAVSYSVNNAYVRETYNFSPRVRAEYETRLKRMAVNPEMVAAIPPYGGAGSRSLPSGDYEYVIITSSTYESTFQTLADFYTKCGIPATIETTSYISSHYGSGSSGIRGFVKDANSTWGSIYFLLGGDTGVVPYNTKNISGDNIPNDTYYSDYDDDYKCEVYVGRAPVDSTSQATNFVNKVMDYMTAPPAGFGEEVCQWGFDLDSSTQGEDLMIYIDNHWVPSWAYYTREYDSESGTHKSDCRSYMNSGQGVLNHCDHCNYNILGVGSYHHGDTFSNSDASNFSNGDRAGIFYTLGCYPGAYDYSDCWGEALVKNTGGGAVGFVGNSRYGWYSPGSMSTYSAAYDRKFFDRLWTYDDYRVGVTLAESKNNSSTSGTTYKYIFTELTLQGDPAMPVWTDVPGTLTVTYDSQINTGSQSFTVNVKSGSSNLYGALVCVSKSGEVYERGTTNYSGNVTFTINPQTAGTMDVTATAHNEKVFEGTCTVNSGPPPDLDIDLTLNKTNYARGEKIKYDLDLWNNSSSTKYPDVWTNITLPNSNIYPSSGYLDGPFHVTISAGAHKSASLQLSIPWGAPLGNYVFNAYCGPNPGVDDEDHEPFSILW